MIFGFILKKKITVPLEAGEMIELKIPEEKETRVLYAKVIKISKKKNVFVRFFSTDNEKSLQVGLGGTLTAIHQNLAIQYQTKLLHISEDGAFIFSPPETFTRKKIPPNPETLTYSLNLPIEYRAMTSLHAQQGTLVEFSPGIFGILVNNPIPAATHLAFELFLPWKERTAHVKAKVITCEPFLKDPRKKLALTALEEFSTRDREALVWYAILRWGFPEDVDVL